MTVADYEKAIYAYRRDTGKLPVRRSDLMVEPKNVRGWKGPYLDGRRSETNK